MPSSTRPSILGHLVSEVSEWRSTHESYRRRCRRGLSTHRVRGLSRVCACRRANGEGGRMKRFIVRRVGYALLPLVVLSATIFVFVRLTGDPSVLLVEPGASKADIDAIRTDLGLDRPLIVQYALFLKGLLRGDFGRSFYYRTPVLELYFERLPNSLMLALVAMAFSLAIGIPSGILAAVRDRKSTRLNSS